jgi:hypothetical protein
VAQPNPLAAQSHDNIRRVDLQEIMEQMKKNSDDMGLMRQDLQNQSLNPNAIQKIGTDINQLQTQQAQMLENVKEYHTSLRIQANEQTQLLGAQGANYNKRMNVQLGTITNEIAKLNTTADISQDLAMAHAITSLPVGSGHGKDKLEGQLNLYNVIQNHIKYPATGSTALQLARKSIHTSFGELGTTPLGIRTGDPLEVVNENIDRARGIVLQQIGSMTQPPRPQTPPPLLITAPPSPATSPAIQFSNRPQSVMTSMTATPAPEITGGAGRPISVSPSIILPEDYDDEDDDEDDDDDEDEEAGAP